MDVEVAGGPGQLGHVDAVVALMRLARRQRIVEAPELVERAHQEPLRARPQAHAALEGAIEDRQLAVRPQAEQEQLAGLVGGEGEAEPLLGQPGGELTRRGQVESGGRMRSRGHGAGRHADVSSRPRAAAEDDRERLPETWIRHNASLPRLLRGTIASNCARLEKSSVNLQGA
jgi:hypothetical protein